MSPETYEIENKKNNEPIQQLKDELSQITDDNDKSNDEITGVFNQELIKSFDYTNFGNISELVEKIDNILGNPTLELDDNTTKQLKDIKTLLQNRYDYILDDFSIDTTPVNFDFLNSLSLENDIKTLFEGENYKKIKPELIKKDRNGKDYVLIKQNRFYIGDYGGEKLSNRTNNNVILFDNNDLYLGNANCNYHYDVNYNELSISDGNITELKLNNGQRMTMSKSSDGKEIRSSNGIDINCKLNYKEKYGRYGLYYNNDSEIFLGVHEDPCGLFVKITSILSEVKKNGVQCEKINDNMLKIGDSTHEFNCSEDINKIAEWINNYKFSD